jgi:NAD(P) transhydrogenase subunit beta
MCKAMNRSFFNVILGGFGRRDRAAAAAGGRGAAGQERLGRRRRLHHGNAESVIIVPGYGMAVAQAQHAVGNGRQAQEARASA